MRSALALLGLSGCVFISADEHAARLGAESGETADTADTAGGGREMQPYEGSFSLEITTRDEQVACTGPLALELWTTPGVEEAELLGGGSCTVTSAESQRVSGLSFELGLTGSVDAAGAAAGLASLDLGGNLEEADWTGSRSEDGSSLSGAFSAEIQISGEGRAEVAGAWEAAATGGS